MSAFANFRIFIILAYVLLIDYGTKNYGITQTKQYNLPSLRRVASIFQTTNHGFNYNFLINSLFNKSRLLENVIYTDVISNINKTKGREKTESKQPTVLLKMEEKKNVSDSTGPPFSTKPYKNIFLSDSNDLNFDLLNTSNSFTKQVAPYQKSDEYLIGFSGNLFGSRIPAIEMIKVAQVSDSNRNDSMGKILSDLRQKRSVVHLYNMVLCATGCNPFAYKGYGCYCGFLGSGYEVDGIDSCCKIHDRCYIKAGCPMFLEYFIPYLWKCYYHQPLCAIDHRPFGGPKSCSQRLCECDRQLALCLRRYPCPSIFKMLLRQRDQGQHQQELNKIMEEEKLYNKMQAELTDSKIKRRKNFVHRLELECREASLNGVVLKAEEVENLRQNQLKQEEKLAAELDLLRRQEIADEKNRLYLRENSHELKELESQLKAAYMKKAIATQLAEKEAYRYEDELRDRKAREVMEKAIGTWAEQEYTQMLNEKMQKEQFKHSLQDQIIEKERIRQEEFMSFLKEKKLFDDIVQKIKEDEERDLEEKRCSQQKAKEEMQQFFKAREVWKAKERYSIQLEEAKIKEVNEERERAQAQLNAKKVINKEAHDKLYKKLSDELVERQRQRDERENLISLLIWNERETKENQKLQEEMERERAKKQAARDSYVQIMAEKAKRKNEEKELELYLTQQMKIKAEEEERLEKEKKEKRRQEALINMRYNAEAMKQNIQKRAEELKLTQLVNELQEKEEKRKAQLVEEERMRILKEHAPKLMGFFPKGCLREQDLEKLGITGNSPLPESCPLTEHKQHKTNIC